MRVLVDTSVWSLSFRKAGPEPHPAARKLAALLTNDEDVVITGTILQEILQAFRSEATAARIERYLEDVPLVPLSREDFSRAAHLKRLCASKGVAASTVDCQIASAAIGHGCVLLTADRDFERIGALTKLVTA